MRSRLCILLILIVLSQNDCFPQIGPASRNFTFTPVVFNSAYHAISEESITLIHRQQWSGFEDAPIASGFNLSFPNQKRLDFGVRFLSEEAASLRSSSLSTSFVYTIYGQQERRLFFSLSGGVAFNDLDLQGRDYSNDPTILKAAQRGVSMVADFGLLYKTKNVQLGFALPTLISQKYYNNARHGSSSISQLLNQLYSATYIFPITAKSTILPFAFYSFRKDLNNFFEAGIKYNYNNRFWAGTSYQQHNGPAFFLGGSVKKFAFNYVTEIPSNKLLKTITHDFTLCYYFRQVEKKQTVIAPGWFRF